MDDADQARPKTVQRRNTATARAAALRGHAPVADGTGGLVTVRSRRWRGVTGRAPIGVASA